jgi:Ring finger domain
MSILGVNNIQSADESVPREHPVIIARPHDGSDATDTYPTNIAPTAEDLKASENLSPVVGDRSRDVGEGSSSDIPPKTSGRNNVVPASIGREICPICIVDFEEGDDIRVLPCEGKHSFHQQCVDPWLLTLSSSCPICRQGELLSPLC